MATKVLKVSKVAVETRVHMVLQETTDIRALKARKVAVVPWAHTVLQETTDIRALRVLRVAVETRVVKA